uniref:Uncharacterized protein n=1 Tax=Anguilla anguilla TaxID=7936 RepID=A0A0E9S3M5_ANGAN
MQEKWNLLCNVFILLQAEISLNK